jgi:sulfur-oxidizing protein SoxY
MSMNRRTVVKAIAASGALMGLGALMPRVAMAAWNKSAFEAKSESDALNALYGGAADPTPLAAEFVIPAGTEADVSTRVRMGKTTMVTAVVKAGGKLYSASKEVKVTIGGCGG